MAVAYDMTKEQSLIADSQIFWLLHSLCPQIFNFPWALFLRLQYNYISPFPFFTPIISYTHTWSLSNSLPLVINWCYWHVTIYILKYKLISLYDITCICVFRADHLVLYNQLLCFRGDVLFFSQHFLPVWNVLLWLLKEKLEPTLYS